MPGPAQDREGSIGRLVFVVVGPCLLHRYASRCAAIAMNWRSVAEGMEATCGKLPQVVAIPGRVGLVASASGGPRAESGGVDGPSMEYPARVPFPGRRREP